MMRICRVRLSCARLNDIQVGMERFYCYIAHCLFYTRTLFFERINLPTIFHNGMAL